jgi:NAD(P)-dependent dehydrogenase (short-subunit alcohol dehydrogenase family)
MVEGYGQNCFLIAGDISKERNCAALVRKTIKQFGRIDILVNNAACKSKQKNWKMQRRAI